MQQAYSFLDVSAGIVGPGIAAQLGNGAGAAEEGISVAATEDLNKMDVGADGTVLHSLHADKSGMVTIRLMKNSPANAVLMAALNLQRASSAAHGQNTINITNRASGDSITCTQCAFKKWPDNTYAKDANILEWEFHAGRIEGLLGA